MRERSVDGPASAPGHAEWRPDATRGLFPTENRVCAGCKGIYGAGVVHQCKEKRQ